ncbi:MAG TPA: hypothetical protein DEP24_00795, partial [Mycobacterium sp.]|nr:hypothetical protein [Mycobacterium sp.]
MIPTLEPGSTIRAPLPGHGVKLFSGSLIDSQPDFEGSADRTLTKFSIFQNLLDGFGLHVLKRKPIGIEPPAHL